MTAQAHEELIIDGEETSMAFCPPIPADHPRIKEIDPESARPRDENSWIVQSAACWRGYIGTWKIVDDRFFLKSIIGCVQLLGDEPLLADWFTGVLRIPEGEIIKYVHMGYGSIHERERHIRIEKGVVVGSRTIDNDDRRANQERGFFDDFPGTENSFKGDDYWNHES